MCDNKVTMNIRNHADLDTREITFKCGDYTSNGLAQCDECEAKANADYPQGWVHYPGDKCKHGTYIGGDRDCACYKCEEGDDEEPIKYHCAGCGIEVGSLHAYCLECAPDF
jgi:hypothetical protein